MSEKHNEWLEIRRTAKELGIDTHKKTKKILLSEIQAAQAGQQPESSVAEDKKTNIRERPKRRPMFERDTVFEVPGYKLEPGYHYHWVNDENNKVQRCKEAGYETVQLDDKHGKMGKPSDMGKTMRRHVGSKRNGEDLYAVLMRIPQEWYDEDQECREMERKRGEAAIIRRPRPGDDLNYGINELSVST